MEPHEQPIHDWPNPIDEELFFTMTKDRKKLIMLEALAIIAISVGVFKNLVHHATKRKK